MTKGVSGQNPGGESPRRVVVEGGADLTAEIQAGRAALRADEDEGPTPYGLLLSALGSCSAMTMRLYADRKGIPLEGVTIALEHSRQYVDDCRDCTEGRPKRLDHIDKVISVRGDLTEEDVDRLIEISDKCPVQRTLQGEVRVRSRRAETPSDGTSGPRGSGR